jgi:carboxypeptidase T
MRSISIFVVCFVLFGQLGFSQDLLHAKYAKVKVNLIGRDIRELAKAGLETDHGIFVKNRYFVNDFSTDELAIIRSLGFEVEVLIDDVATYYAQENRQSELHFQQNQQRAGCMTSEQNEYPYTTPSQYTEGSMNGYFTYKEMLDILDTMSARYPNLISPIQEIAGFTTYQGNTIKYLKLSDNPNAEENEPKVLYTALHHAREPNSLSQMIFYLWYLLENYETDATVKRIVDETQMYFVPCLNPDGYLLNEQTNPGGGGLWRKNAWKDTLGDLKGVDLNRNYGFFWGFDNFGSSNNPNSQTYRGTAGFSEPETQAIRQLCLDNEFKIAQNYHSFGNYLIHPWGYNDSITAEDKLFKTIGRVMNRENKFLMGTGTETVGYVVNGDSDDWMYGEVGEKAKIYSYTPEVGPSFWPPKVDIDYLNRSCVWMNLATALVVLNYYEANEIVLQSYLSPSQRQIKVNVSRAGLKDGVANVVLLSNTNGVVVNNSLRSVELGHAESIELTYTMTIDTTLNYENGISFTLSVDNDGIITDKVITKEWISGKFTNVLTDGLNTNVNFGNSDWQLTGSQFYSAPFAMTDSPDTDYLENTQVETTIKTPFSLEECDHAFLSFYAKWAIEAGYDYVQVLASRDNVDYIPLCGLYTRPGTQDQSFNNPIYDGVQADWVKEQIDLSDFLGEKRVWIKFVLVSDGGVEADGFYFDDLEVNVVKKTVISSTQDDIALKIYPSVISGQNECFVQGLKDGNNIVYKIVDINGQTIHQDKVQHGKLDLTKVKVSGNYFIEFWDQSVSKGIHKIAVIR